MGWSARATESSIPLLCLQAEEPPEIKRRMHGFWRLGLLLIARLQANRLPPEEEEEEAVIGRRRKEKGRGSLDDTERKQQSCFCVP